MALILVLIGIACGVGACSTGLTWRSLRSEHGIISLWPHQWGITGAVRDVKPEVQEFSKTENIREINLDARSAEVNICPLTDWTMEHTGAEDSFVVEVYERNQPVSVTSENGKLSVKANANSSFHIGFVKSTTVNIYVPSEAELSGLSLKCNSGDISILADIRTENLEVTTGSGNIANTGKLSVLKDARIYTGSGDTTLQSVDCGRDMEMTCGSGNIWYAGTVAGNLDGQTGSGDLEISLNGNEEDYNYRIDCGSGDVVVNGRSYEHHMEHEHSGNDRTITLRCGSGDMVLNISE